MGSPRSWGAACGAGRECGAGTGRRPDGLTVGLESRIWVKKKSKSRDVFPGTGSCPATFLNEPKWEIRYSKSMDAATNHAVARNLGPRKSSGPALLLCRLRKAFGDVRAVDGIDLEVAAGECFGLLGPNGAGKTTTIEICEGLTAPDAGTVELLGLNWQTSAKELRQRIGIQLQETSSQTN